MQTQQLDKFKIIKNALLFFLDQEEALKNQWRLAIGTEREAPAFLEYLAKRTIIQDMMNRLLLDMKANNQISE